MAPYQHVNYSGAYNWGVRCSTGLASLKRKEKNLGQGRWGGVGGSGGGGGGIL